MFKNLQVLEAHFQIKKKKKKEEEQEKNLFKHFRNLTQHVQLTKIHLIDSKADPQTKLFC